MVLVQAAAMRLNIAFLIIGLVAIICNLLMIADRYWL